MIYIFGFYKFKKIIKLKKLKRNLQTFFKENKLRGNLILSPEGINGSISFKNHRINIIKKYLKSTFGFKKFDNENTSICNFQPFKKAKIKIKKEVVPIGAKLKKKYIAI